MSNSIKKVYAELVQLLEDNKGKKVSQILDQVYALAESKQSSRNFLTDDQGQVTHIYCYYHKLWEPVAFYGTKKNSPSGYNSMCKEGVNAWTKQQREFKKAESELLTRVMSGEISPDQIQDEKVRLEQEKSKIVPRTDGVGTEVQPS